MNRGIKYEYAIKQNASLTAVLPRLLTGPDAGKVPSMPETMPLRRPADHARPHDAPALPPSGQSEKLLAEADGSRDGDS